MAVDGIKDEKKVLNQKLFAQNLKAEQRQFEVEQYSKEIEKQKKEQDALNQKLFARNLEVEQRQFEVEQYLKEIEKQKAEQDALNQKLFARNLEVEQRNFEAEQYTTEIEKQKKEQDALNQKLFAQKMEVEQRNFEVEQYVQKIEEQKEEQDGLNQKLFARSLEVEQRSFETNIYSKEIEKLKDKAEDALKTLDHSINYSKTIIESLLPSKKQIKKIYKNSFVMFRPRDVIGGDFYFVNNVKDYTVFAVADSTGHGVPGALISMLGITYLNEIVARNLVDNTGDALGLLRTYIQKAFKSHGENVHNANGMDIALCAINRKTNIMQYSGAFSSIYIVRKNELTEHSATRNPIGYYPKEREFETIDIKLENDDIIYLFTDGYRDQFNFNTGRKMRRDQFKQLLYEIHNYRIDKQGEYLDLIFQKWKGKMKQVDDVTVMGIKWKM